MAAQPQDSDWLARIAKRAKVSEEEVKEALAAERIVASPAPGKPRRLLIKGIRFSGVKVDVPNDGPFDFVWEDLEHGLYAIVTEKNQRGKSSIIEIVRWMLRGHRSDLLQADVFDWIRTAELRFSLDEHIYAIRIEKESGLEGSLVNLHGDAERIVVRFSTSNEFEMAMADFFLKELSLEEMTVWTKVAGTEREKAVVHGWPALAGVMYVGTDYTSLLGDVPVTAGLSSRLLQMFLGLPWVSTATVAKAALAGAEEEHRALARREKDKAADRETRRKQIQHLLDAKREERQALPINSNLAESYRTTIDSIRELNARRRVEETRLDEDRRAVTESKQAYDSDRRELRAYLDASAAGAIFRQIAPSSCPRCESAIGDERRERELKEYRCFVCGEDVQSDSGADQFEADLKLARDASKAAYEAAKEREVHRVQKLAAIDEQHNDLLTSLSQLEREALAVGGAKVLDLEIAALEGQIKELLYVPPSAEEVPPTVPILNAILRETESLMKERQQELLDAVSEKMLDYAKRFGIQALSSLQLKGNLHLEVNKGGSKTTYGSSTPGEKLRLKVAAVLALISVAESQGIGRHPGLLLIDSPAAQEVNPEDLDQLTAGLEEISNELDHLQIIVASRVSNAITNHIAPEHLLAAYDDAALW